MHTRYNFLFIWAYRKNCIVFNNARSLHMFVTKVCGGNDPKVKHNDFTSMEVRDEFEFQGFSICIHVSPHDTTAKS